MYKKSLFGLDKNGGFKVWNIAAYFNPEEPDLGGALTISHGKEGGKLTKKDEIFETGKQGRDGYQQAVFEAQSRIKKQMDKGYRETKEELTDLPVLAMLSKDHTKSGKEEVVAQGVYTSDKLDGLRCLAKCKLVDGVKTVTLESRTGQPYDVPHIHAELMTFMEPGMILDGELYVHGPVLQEIKSAVDRVDAEQKEDDARAKLEKACHLLTTKGKPVAQKLYDDVENAKLIANIRAELQFHVFDIVTDEPFEVRLSWLGHVAKDFGTHVVAVPYSYAIGMDELVDQLKDCISRGYEGIMYRTPDGLYESGKRSSGLWKFKLFFDEEFEIVGAHTDKQGYIVFELANNMLSEKVYPNMRYTEGGFAIFDCVMGDYAFRLEAAGRMGDFIGKHMTVQFQSRFKNTLLPQFPTGKLIREGKIIDGEFVPDF